MLIKQSRMHLRKHINHRNLSLIFYMQMAALVVSQVRNWNCLLNVKLRKMQTSSLKLLTPPDVTTFRMYCLSVTSVARVLSLLLLKATKGLLIRTL